jgi:hypothetical protein
MTRAVRAPVTRAGRHPRKVRVVVGAIACAAAVASSAVAHPGSASAATSSLQGNATPVLDDPAGQVAVVSASAAVDRRVAFVVQNGTDHWVRVVTVTGAAANPSGSSAARATTGDAVPARLAPGDTAIGRLRFRPGTLEPGASFTWRVDARRTDVDEDPVRLVASDFELSSAMTGKVAQTLELTVTNPHDTARFGPLPLQVLCVNEAGRPALGYALEVGRRRLDAQKSVQVTVAMRYLCPSYLVGVASRASR